MSALRCITATLTLWLHPPGASLATAQSTLWVVTSRQAAACATKRPTSVGSSATSVCQVSLVSPTSSPRPIRVCLAWSSATTPLRSAAAALTAGVCASSARPVTPTAPKPAATAAHLATSELQLRSSSPRCLLLLLLLFFLGQLGFSPLLLPRSPCLGPLFPFLKLFVQLFRLALSPLFLRQLVHIDHFLVLSWVVPVPPVPFPVEVHVQLGLDDLVCSQLLASQFGTSLPRPLHTVFGFVCHCTTVGTRPFPEMRWCCFR
mmetsp:Transcript_25698/g.50626  ORF Transcript_25698/g.50626 Transcript_25698/m.50626 type:complete len:261 (+) Transcript_25698:2935-3717(+)